MLQVISLFSLTFLLSGCLGIGDDNTPTPQTNTNVVPSDRQITLIWWNLFEPEENMQPLMDAYQAKYPNVTIEYSEKSVADYQQNLEKVLTDGQPETTPDIFTVPNNQVGRYNNYTLPAPTEVIDVSTFSQNFYSVVADDMIIDNNIRAIPLGVDSLAIIYNKDILATKGYTIPATNWTDLKTQATNLTTTVNNQISQAGLSLSASDNSGSWFDIFNLLLLQSEVSMLNETNTQAIFAADDATTEAVSYFQSYAQSNVWDEALREDIAMFLDKKLAFYIAPSWRLLDVIRYNEAYNLGINYGIAPMPQLSSLEADSTGWATYWTQMVSFDSANYKVAWDFLNFATQPQQLQLTYDKAVEARAFGQIYPRADMKSQLENDANLGVFVNQVSIAKSWQMTDGAQVKATFEKWLNNGQTAVAAESNVTSIINSEGFLSGQ